MPTSSLDLIDRLQQRAGSVLDPMLKVGMKCALVDFPNHNNSGDSAIWLGELAYLASRGVSVDYVCDTSTYSAVALSRSVPEGPILLHGGGNFGDVWPGHHDFRLKVMSDFPERFIIQMPQTIRVTGESFDWRPARPAAESGRLVILCRDKPSLQVASTLPWAECALTPDMAVFLGAQRRRLPATHDIVWISRSDHERQHETPVMMGIGSSVLITDWLQTNGVEHLKRSASVRVRRSAGAIASQTGDQRWLAWVRSAPVRPHRALASRRFEQAMRILSRGRVVVADRLHAHILALLLGIPHVLLDDRHGKITSFVEAFGTDIPGVLIADTPTDAFDMAQQLVRELPS